MQNTCGENLLKQLIFADESSTDKLRYMLIGGIWVDEPTYLKVLEECKEFKLSNGWQEQTKFNWKNLSNKTFSQYCQFIDIFFKYNLQFNCIIIDRKEVDLKNNEFKDPELGFYKFYYQLLRQNSKPNIPYYIYLDRRTNREPTRLETLKTFLKQERHPINSMGFRTTEKGLDVKTIEFVNSKSYELIQFSDILMGAISYHYNKKHLLPEASRNKCELAQYIATKINKPDLVFNTPKTGHKNFNLWLFKPNKALTIK